MPTAPYLHTIFHVNRIFCLSIYAKNNLDQLHADHEKQVFFSQFMFDSRCFIFERLFYFQAYWQFDIKF